MQRNTFKHLIMIIFPEHILPDKHKGLHTKKTYLTKNQPRRWTEKEIEHIQYLKKLGFNNDYIAQCVDRDNVSVQIKLKRLNKKNESYNKKHIQDKYNTNQKFIDIIKPQSVLDLYAGSSWYKDKVKYLTTNDKNTKYKTTYNEDAARLISLLYYHKKKYDIVDLDSFGSAYDCFEIAFRIVKKGLIITLGEFGHVRWKRLDFVSKKYNINTLQDFTLENVDKKIKEKAQQNNCKLQTIFVGNYTNIKRIYYKVI